MPITVTPGITFQQGGGQEYTAAQMNSAFTDMTITGISRENMASTTRPVTVSASAPATPQIGELWCDTNVFILKMYDGTDWHGVGQYSIYTATTEVAVGDIVVLDTAASNSVKTTTNAAGLDQIAGVAVSAAAIAGEVIVQRSGRCDTVNCGTGAVSIGSHLAKSTTAGKADASTTGNSFAVALTSKAGGSNGTVSALLGVVTPAYYTESFATYTLTAASLTKDTWYDVPNAAVGASVTTNGTSRMKLAVNTSRANQPVTVTISGFRLVSNAAANEIVGLRLVLGDSSPTTLFTALTKGQDINYEAAPTPIANGDLEFIGMGTSIFQRSASYVIDTSAVSVTVIVPTAGATTIGLMFVPGLTASYTASNETTATLTAVVH